jgi:uncharacterized lipoprotein YajG
MLRPLMVVVLIVILAGCVSRQVALTYAPSSASLAAGEQSAVVGVKTVIDERSNGPRWLGAIRGGYGNPLKTLETDEPVKDVVATAFADALAARGELAPAGRETILLTVVMRRFDCNQYVRREAHADFEITLANARSGAPIYTDHITADAVNGSVFAMNVGIFASTDDLRMVAVGTLRDAIDQALSKPGFRAALTAALGT